MVYRSLQLKVNFPIGNLYLTASENGLTGIYKEQQASPFTEEIGSFSEKQTNFLQQARTELEQYFAGTRKHFDVKLDINGTPFQRLVWQTLLTIPYGKTISYKQLAVLVGNPQASRAVGAANGKNPLWIIIPCHRVTRSQGDLGGYAGGVATKTFLLNLEKTFSSLNF